MYTYISQRPCRLRQRPKALWPTTQNPRRHSLPQPFSPLYYRHRPLPTVGQPVLLKRRISVNAIGPSPIDTPTTIDMVQRGTRLAIKDKPRERCAAAGVDGEP